MIWLTDKFGDVPLPFFAMTHPVPMQLVLRVNVGAATAVANKLNTANTAVFNMLIEVLQHRHKIELSCTDT